jgi:hypothetical protein
MKRVSASFIPPFALDHKTKTTMYRRLYHWFRHAIASNQLRLDFNHGRARASRKASISPMTIMSCSGAKKLLLVFEID